MITIIFGLPGAGKTAFMTYILKTMYEKERDKIFKFTCNKIRELNREYGTELNFPTHAPIYVNKNYKTPAASNSER